MEVLRSSCKPVYEPVTIEKAVFTTVVVLSICLYARKYRETSFHQCGGAVNLMLAFLSTRRNRESSFHHCGGPVKLLEAWLCTRRHLESSFHPLWRFCEAHTNLFIYQESSRKQFSLLWWSCQGRGGLFKCRKYREIRFHHCGSAVNLV